MRQKKLLKIIDRRAAVLERRQSALNDAIERLTELSALTQRRFAPMAGVAAERLRPVLKQGARLAQEAFERAQPAVEEMVHKVGPVVSAGMKRIQPGVEELLIKLPPAVEAAKASVKAELLPLLTKEPEPAAELEPRIEVVVVEPKKKSWKKRIGLFVLFAAIAGIAVAVKKALEPPAETGWASYTPTDSFVAHPGAEATEDFVPTAEALSDPADEEVAAEPELEPDTGAVDAGQESPYGEGSYVGDNPPEGFTIKGNARSKKYHQVGGAHYGQTIAEVWFSSTQAAEAAGFQAAKS